VVEKPLTMPPNAPDRFDEVMSSKVSDPLVRFFERYPQTFSFVYVRLRRRRRDPRGHPLDPVKRC
jgi:hypothetical protein